MELIKILLPRSMVFRTTTETLMWINKNFEIENKRSRIYCSFFKPRADLADRYPG